MKKETRIGLFAVIVIAAALFMIEFLKGRDIFSSNNTYYIIYPSVEGLDISTSITVGGYNAGTVSDISYSNARKDYTVTVSVSKDFKIPEDSRMEVYSSDILGTKKIRVLMGSSGINAQSGDTLDGTAETDMLSALGGSLDTVIRQIGTVAESVNTLLDERNRKEIGLLINRLNNTAANLDAITGMIRSKGPDMEIFVDNLNSIARKLDSAAVSAGNVLDNAENVTASIRDAGISETIDSLRMLLSKIQDPAGSTGKLLASDSLYNSITSLSNNLDSLVQSIRRDPKKYIKISVF